jgi:hydrogenase nickel incorporation protein HypA/HybF
VEIDMHELAIAQNIVDIIKQYVSPDLEPGVRLIRLRVGKMSGIVPDSLEFCFSAVVSDTPLAHAGLDIERVPTQAQCPDCGVTFVIEDPVFICPECCGTALRLVSGTELQVVEIELADQESETV